MSLRTHLFSNPLLRDHSGSGVNHEGLGSLIREKIQSAQRQVSLENKKAEESFS
jgi:hypothetical protein